MARRQPAVRKVPSFPPTQIKVATFGDFTGGLNTRANAFQLGQNETPDCLDVDLQIGGGFVQRKVVQRWASSNPPQPVQNMWAYETLSAQQVVMEGTDGKIYASAGTTWSTVSSTVRQLCTAAVFNGYIYVMDGVAAAVSWNTSSATTMGTAWNETIGGEGTHDGNMPIASLCTVHMSRFWVANTTEGGVNFPNRVRWSHVGFAEDWRQEDFIDIDVGRDGDEITAIIEFRERLYIFKNEACYVLSGYSPATFQVVPLAQDIGCVGPMALCLTDVGLFTFSWNQGVFLDKGTGPYPIFDKVWPMIRDGFIEPSFRNKIAMGWVNRNLWVGVPWQGASTNTRTLVYDPWIWKHRYMRFLEGPWYPYSLPCAAFCRLDTSAGTLHLAGNSTIAAVAQLDQVGGQDSWNGTASNVNSYYKTTWYPMGQEAIVKRWRHPELIMRSGQSANMQVDVRRDWDPDTVYATYFVTQNQPPQSGLIWQYPPVSLNVTTAGTPGTTTYEYTVTPVFGTVEGPPESITITTGAATLNSTNYNVLTWTAGLPSPTPTSYNVYGKTTTSQTLITNTTSLSYNDQGASPGVQAAPVVNPATQLWDDGSGTVGAPWTAPLQAGEIVAKGQSMGSARAIQLTFTGPTGTFWGVDAYSLKWIPKRLRG